MNYGLLLQFALAFGRALSAHVGLYSANLNLLGNRAF